MKGGNLCTAFVLWEEANAGHPFLVEEEKEREGERAYLLVHSPNVLNGWDGNKGRCQQPELSPDLCGRQELNHLSLHLLLPRVCMGRQLAQTSKVMHSTQTVK